MALLKRLPLSHACHLRLTFAILIAIQGAFQNGHTHAADDTLDPAFAGIVRIVNRDVSGVSLGSGTVIQRDKNVALVLTCAHLFADNTGEIAIVSPVARPRRAVLVGIDEENDLACLIMQQEQGQILPVSKRLPRIGSRLTSCGFGPEGIFGINRGEHLCYATLKGGADLGVLEIAGVARMGDSGGPILNQRSEVVGVIMGTDGKTINGKHCEQIQEFLTAHPVTEEHLTELAKLSRRRVDRRLASLRATFDGAIEADAELETKVRLTGHVRFNDHAVSEAEVRLIGPTERVSVLDNQGRFVFENLPAGRYRVEVAKVVRNIFRFASRNVVVARSRHGQEIELQLK